jgi:hypothetical protein
MNYKHPKTFQIGSHTLNIKFMEASATDNTNDHVATCNTQRCVVTIATKTSNGEDRALSYIEQSLMHEIVHSINTIFESGLDEANVERIAQGLTQVLSSVGIHLVEEVQDAV